MSAQRVPSRVAVYWPELAVAVVLALSVLGAVLLGATGAATFLLIAALPVLYLAYLNEVDRWSDQGVVPIAVSLVLGLAVGVGWGVVVRSAGLPDRMAAVAVVLIPSLLAVVGCVLIHLIDRYDEVLDGFAFSAAIIGGWYLGFLTVVVVPEALADTLAPAPVWQFIAAVAPTALLLPVAVSAPVGVLVAAAWVSRDPGPQYVPKRWIAAAVGVLLGLVVMGVALPGAAGSVAWLGPVAVVSLMIARYSIAPLLEKAGELHDD
jgi:hypothetical protein